MRKPAAAMAACALWVTAMQAAPSFVNGLAIPGATGDKYGTSVNDGRVGFFSDIYYDASRHEWWGLSDRGPGGGTLNYDTRVQRFTIDINPSSGAISNFQIADTIKFTNNGAPLNGIAPSPTNVLGNSFDPEGIVVNPATGHLLVSDEYGPSVREFDRNGSLIRNFTTPDNLIPRNAANVPNFADDTGNVAGKRTNRGFEGLAVSPDGKYVYATLQSAMLDEGGGNGTVNRIVKFDAVTGQAVAQYAYQMDTASQGRGVSALTAINDHEFLVLERNNRGVGVGADFATADKRVYKIDITGATDVTSINVTASGAAYTAVTKASSVYLNIAANTLAALGNKTPEKFESLAFGPTLSDGGFFLLTGTDNDYSVTQNGSGTQYDVYFRFSDADPYATSIQCPLGQITGCFSAANGSATALSAEYALLPGVLYGYKVPASDFPTYVAPSAVPEPATLPLLAAGLAAFAAFRIGKRSKQRG